ncbi:MAG: ZIP family metal transporter [Thermomicrobiales bacterium]
MSLALANTSIWVLLLIPVVATMAGGFLSSVLDLGPKTRSGVQHFASGVIFAAVAGELLPELSHTHAPVWILIGFLAGVALMLGIQHATRGGDNSAGDVSASNGGLLAAVAIDAVIDGLLLGLAFAAGEATGLVFTAALALEMFFLALSTGSILRVQGAPVARMFGLTIGLAGILAASAAFSTLLSGALTGPGLIVATSLAAAALLFLVTEELLVEAHETAETPLLTALFFVGFIGVYLASII